MPSNTPKNATPAAIDSPCGLPLRAATLNRVPPPAPVDNRHDPTGRANDPVDVTTLTHRSERTHHVGMSSQSRRESQEPAFVRAGRELTRVRVPSNSRDGAHRSPAPHADGWPPTL